MRQRSQNDVDNMLHLRCLKKEASVHSGSSYRVQRWRLLAPLGGGTGKRAVTFSTRRLQPLKGSADLDISLLNSFRFYDSSWGYC